MPADITFALEPLSPDLWDEIRPLADAHHAETRASEPPLDIDVHRYAVLSEGGALRVYTARLEHALVGYATFVVGKSMRHRRRIIATHDALYVRPEHRTACGLRLTLYADRALTLEGVHLIRQFAVPDSPFAALLEHVGYQPAERAYEKHLGEPVHG